MPDDARPGRPESREVGAAVRAGDQAAFARLAERHRRELHVHCYRMLASFHDAEDQVQETLLRAWRKREAYQGRSSFRAWLYGIATNACLDLIARDKRRAGFAAVAAHRSQAAFTDIPWLEPFPDELFDGVEDAVTQPDAVADDRETIELAFLATMQYLPATQRAVMIMRDVHGWSAKETAELLELTVAGVNSALQRAHETMRARLPQRRDEWRRSAPGSATTRDLLRRYMDAHANADVDAIAALLRDDVALCMPPLTLSYTGSASVRDFFAREAFGEGSPGDLKLVATSANGQPAAANYVRRHGETVYRAMSLDVLRFDDGGIAEITVFAADMFAAFGLAQTL